MTEPTTPTVDDSQRLYKAIGRLKELIDHTPECDLSNMHRDEDPHDLADSDTRMILTAAPEEDALNQQYAFSEHYYELVTLVRDILTHVNDPHMDGLRTFVSTLALDMSLCPVHLVDYAICFDDEVEECALIRQYFPSHDT